MANYELKDKNGIQIFEANTYNDMWTKLSTYANNHEIDHFIVKDNVHHTFDYAWRVLRNLNDVSVY